MQPAIDIYYAEMCSLCHEAMDYFRARGIPFRAIELRWKNGAWVDSEQAREFVRRCGPVDFVPQIFIGNRHIAGWRTLSQLIATGEVEELLKSVPERTPAAEGPPHPGTR